MLRFVRYWGDVTKRTAMLLLHFYTRLDLVLGTLGLAGVGVATALQHIPLRALIAVAILLALYALVLALYKKFTEVEDRKDELEEKLATAKKRKAIKDLLGVAVQQGKDLQKGPHIVGGQLKKGGSQQDIEKWVHRTRDFIEAAFDMAEAQRFMDSSDYKPAYNLPWREVRVDPYKYHIEPRLQRLNELIMRANEPQVNPDFDDQYWRDRFNLE